MIFTPRPPRPPKPLVTWHESWAIIPRRLLDGRIAWLHSIGYKALDRDNRYPWVYDTWDNIALELMRNRGPDLNA